MERDKKVSNGFWIHVITTKGVDKWVTVQGFLVTEEYFEEAYYDGEKFDYSPYKDLDLFLHRRRDDGDLWEITCGVTGFALCGRAESQDDALSLFMGLVTPEQFDSSMKKVIEQHGLSPRYGGREIPLTVAKPHTPTT